MQAFEAAAGASQVEEGRPDLSQVDHRPADNGADDACAGLVARQAAAVPVQ
jgi:hypothetical protein